MEKLKGLSLITLVIILQGSICSCGKLKNTIAVCTGIVEVYTDSSHLELKKDDFTFLETQTGLDLKILNKSKLEKVKQLNQPFFRFCIDEIYQIAKPISILSSVVPIGADYFYPIPSEGSIMINKENIVSFRKVKRRSHQ